MPELPDITVYVHALQRRILHQRLLGIRMAHPFLLRSVTPSIGETTGRSVTAIHRWGKRIVIGLENGILLVLHLMIAGRLHWRKSGAKITGKADQAAFDFSSGTLVLTEAGSKRRASLHLVDGDNALAKLFPRGVEILESPFSTFRESLFSEHHTLKRALTDPHLFSGIGNAYSDEILHRARLSPLKFTSSLEDHEIERLFKSAREILRMWIEKLGMEAGEEFPEKVTAFREGMSVHGKYRNPCPVCGTEIQRIVYAGNECNYCPRCQTDGRILADRAYSRLLKGDWPKTIEELEEKKESRKKNHRNDLH